MSLTLVSLWAWGAARNVFSVEPGLLACRNGNHFQDDALHRRRTSWNHLRITIFCVTVQERSLAALVSHLQTCMYVLLGNDLSKFRPTSLFIGCGGWPNSLGSALSHVDVCHANRLCRCLTDFNPMQVIFGAFFSCMRRPEPAIPHLSHWLRKAALC